MGTQPTREGEHLLLRAATVLIFLTILIVFMANDEESGWIFQLPASDKRIRTFGEASETKLPKRISVLVWNTYKQRDQAFAATYQRLAATSDLVLLQ